MRDVVLVRCGDEKCAVNTLWNGFLHQHQHLAEWSSLPSCLLRLSPFSLFPSLAHPASPHHPRTSRFPRTALPARLPTHLPR